MTTGTHSVRKCTLLASDIASPEIYARDHRAWHAEAIAHREARTVRLGPNAILAFEDELTVRYQLQQMLCAERICEPAQVQSEIDTFASMIPNGANFKATLTLEYADAAERLAKTGGLIGIEHNVWLRIEGLARIFATVAPTEDPCEHGAAPLMHQLTFELGALGVHDVESGGTVSMGIDHGTYHATLTLRDTQRELLLNDLRAE